MNSEDIRLIESLLTDRRVIVLWRNTPSLQVLGFWYDLGVGLRIRFDGCRHGTPLHDCQRSDFTFYRIPEFDPWPATDAAKGQA